MIERSARPAEPAGSPAEVLVFGGGAIGAITSAYLARAHMPFTLIDPWFQNVETIRRSGLHVRRLTDEFVAHPRVLHVDEIGILERPVDILILAMKSYDTEWVARLTSPYLARDAVVVSAQNGINEERIAAIVGGHRVVGCVVAMSGFLEEAGEVMGTTLLAKDAFILGELDASQSSRVDELATLLSPVGRITVTDDIWSALWSKLLLNVMLNALAGVTGLNTPALWSDRRMVSLMVHLGGEAVLVAEGLGRSMADLTPPGMPTGMVLTPSALKAGHLGDAAAVDDVARCFAAMAAGRAGGGEEGKASLLQDMIRRRRTEVDYLNGYIAAEGRALGIETPMNEAITQLVHEAEFHARPPDPGNADELLRAFVRAPRNHA